MSDPASPIRGGATRGSAGILAAAECHDRDQKRAARQARAAKARGAKVANGERRPLTLRQKRFITEYLATGNGTEAARRAGYSGGDTACSVVAHRLLRIARVRAEITRALEAEGLVQDPAQVVREVAQLARKESARDADRLRACELLGRYHAIWTDVQVVRDLPRDPHRLRELIAMELIRIFGPEGLARLAEQAQDLARRGAIPVTAAALPAPEASSEPMP